MITDAAEFDNPVIYVNPAFERLTGYTKEEAAGRNARFLQGDETDKNTIRIIRTSMENEAAFRGSVLNYRKDGTTFWNGLTISPIRDPNGTTSHFVGILSDETERIQLASQLRQAQKMESLGHLTGGVAHDFNNLLAVILGNSEILFEEIADPELKATAELVMTTAEKGADLTQRLLAFGRRQALHPEALELGAVIGSLSDMLDRTLGNQVRLETHSTADQPAYVDRGLFESAILNLALNARDAMPNGGLLTITTEIVHCDEGCRRRPAAWRLRTGHGDRYRRGHDAGGARPRLRSVLHDQGRRQGLRHGPLDGLRLRQAVRRARQHREQARRGHIGAPLSCRCRARPKRGSRSSCVQDLPAACGQRAHPAGGGRAARAPLRLQPARPGSAIRSWRRKPARPRSTS